MDKLIEISPTYWAVIILIAATGFTILWAFDAATHKRLVEVDITDKELQTHRNILVASVLVELSLVLMYWWDIEILPFFIAFLIVRFIHEFIDEIHFHTDRCTPYESNLHLGMWIFVFIKIVGMFMWGFFTNYKGLETLNIGLYIWGFVIFGIMSYISLQEWKRGFPSIKAAILEMIKR